MTQDTQDPQDTQDTQDTQETKNFVLASGGVDVLRSKPIFTKLV